MKSVVFLDRDGVICDEVGLLFKPEQVSLIDCSAEAIAILNSQKYEVVVVTNQPVVARGLCSEEDVLAINRHLNDLLAARGGRVDRFYYCPHHPTEGSDPIYTRDCECRKPKPGMILKAKKDLGIENLGECYLVGDTIGDILAGERAGCKTVLVETGYGGRGKFQDAKPMFRSKDLHDAVLNVILKS